MSLIPLLIVVVFVALNAHAEQRHRARMARTDAEFRDAVDELLCVIEECNRVL